MRKQANVLGFIVTSRPPDRDVFEISWFDNGDPPSGILLIGDCVTMFARRNLAYAAIRRTKRYEKKNGFDWGTDKLRVQRVIAQAK